MIYTETEERGKG